MPEGSMVCVAFVVATGVGYSFRFDRAPVPAPVPPGQMAHADARSGVGSGPSSAGMRKRAWRDMVAGVPARGRGDAAETERKEGSRTLALAIAEEKKHGDPIAKNHMLLMKIADPEKRKEVDNRLLESNMTWVAAILAEMAASEIHRESVLALMNDGRFRRFARSYSRLMPGLAAAIESDREVTRDALPDVFAASSEDLIARYEAELEPLLPPGMGDNLEAGLPPRIVADTLRWYEEENGATIPDPSGHSRPFFWGSH